MNKIFLIVISLSIIPFISFADEDGEKGSQFLKDVSKHARGGRELDAKKKKKKKVKKRVKSAPVKKVSKRKLKIVKPVTGNYVDRIIDNLYSGKKIGAKYYKRLSKPQLESVALKYENIIAKMVKKGAVGRKHLRFKDFGNLSLEERLTLIRKEFDLEVFSKQQVWTYQNRFGFSDKTNKIYAFGLTLMELDAIYQELMDERVELEKGVESGKKDKKLEKKLEKKLRDELKKEKADHAKKLKAKEAKLQKKFEEKLAARENEYDKRIKSLKNEKKENPFLMKSEFGAIYDTGQGGISLRAHAVGIIPLYKNFGLSISGDFTSEDLFGGIGIGYFRSFGKNRIATMVSFGGHSFLDYKGYLEGYKRGEEPFEDRFAIKPELYLTGEHYDIYLSYTYYRSCQNFQLYRADFLFKYNIFKIGPSIDSYLGIGGRAELEIKQQLSIFLFTGKDIIGETLLDHDISNRDISIYSGLEINL